MIIFKRKFRLWLWIILFILFLIILWASFFRGAKPSFSATGSVTLQPGSEGKDSYAFSIYPGSPGSETTLWCGGGSGGPPPAHCYLEFDLSSVPAGATVDSAVLYLYKSGWFSPSGDSAIDMSLHRVTSSWSEATLTWGLEPTSNGSSEATISVGTSNTWYSWSITSLTNSWQTGAVSNYGVMIKHSTESADVGKQFYSSDFGTASLRPKLEIIYSYTDPIPDPDPDPDPDPSDPSDPSNPSNPTNPLDPSNPSNPSDPSDPSNPSDLTNPDDTTDTLIVSSLAKIFQKPEGLRQLANDIAELAAESIAPQAFLAVAGGLSVISALTVIATSLAAQVGLKELLFVIINYILSLFTARKRDKAGLIYDQTTKEPVKGALINLYDFKTMKLVSSAITDHKGHYFFTVKPGDYVMSVVKKGYLFPSHFAKREKTLNEAVYFGQTLKVEGSAEAINIKIPIDPTAKAKSSRTTINVLMYSSLIRMTIMIVGSLVSVFALVFNPIMINYIMTAGYLVLWAMEYFVQHRELKFSKIIDKDTRLPIDLAMTRVVSESGKIKKTYVTDFGGRFIPYLSERDDSIIMERAGYAQAKEKPGKSGFVEGHTYRLKKQ